MDLKEMERRFQDERLPAIEQEEELSRHEKAWKSRKEKYGRTGRRDVRKLEKRKSLHKQFGENPWIVYWEHEY